MNGGLAKIRRAKLFDKQTEIASDGNRPFASRGDADKQVVLIAKMYICLARHDAPPRHLLVKPGVRNRGFEQRIDFLRTKNGLQGCFDFPVFSILLT